MAMKTSHQKVLKVKPPRTSVLLGRLFLLGSDVMNAQDFQLRLTAVLSADVAGCSRMMRGDEAATVKTLEIYKQVMFSLIRQHWGRAIDSLGTISWLSSRVWSRNVHPIRH
jgi:class 3 adenylate cyclase